MQATAQHVRSEGSDRADLLRETSGAALACRDRGTQLAGQGTAITPGGHRVEEVEQALGLTFALLHSRLPLHQLVPCLPLRVLVRLRAVLAGGCCSRAWPHCSPLFAACSRAAV